MTPERAKELLPVIQAFAEGKTVEYRNEGRESWITADRPVWMDGVEYRIKPDPIYTHGYKRYAYVSVQPGIQYKVGLVHDLHEWRVAQQDDRFLGWIDTEWQKHESHPDNLKEESKK